MLRRMSSLLDFSSPTSSSRSSSSHQSASHRLFHPAAFSSSLPDARPLESKICLNVTAVMPSTHKLSKQTSHGTTMNGTNINDESIEARKGPESSSHVDEATKHMGDQFQDSGAFDGDDSATRGYHGVKDFILFNESAPGQDDLVTDKKDSMDIASVKASHGSSSDGTSNSATWRFDASSSSNDLNSGGRGEEVGYYYTVEGVSVVEEEEDRPQHIYSSLAATQPQAGFSPLEGWSMSFQRHESIAYRLEQPPNLSHAFQQLQMWDFEESEIDLS